MERTTLVLGGTGRMGRRVTERVAARGMPVRIGSRDGTPPFDWERQNTWRDVLRGVDAAYLAYFPDLAYPGAASAVRSFAELAVASGVRRLVLLSRRGEEGSLESERAVRESGASWTIVRTSWLSQCFSEGSLLEPVLAGEVALPAPPVGEPFVDAGDVADVAAGALTGDGHGGRVYEVTGPRLLTFAEAVEELGAAARRDIRYTRVSLEQYTAALDERRVPPVEVALLRYLFTEVLDGRNARVTDGVQRALGREPRDFAEYAQATAATGVWR